MNVSFNTKRFLTSCVLLTLAGMFISYVLRLGRWVSWPGILVFAVAASVVIGFLDKASSWRDGAGRSEFLCDTCKYNDPRICNLPDRPNATECDEYRRRG